MTNENFFSELESLRTEAEALRVKGVRDQERLKIYEEEISYLHEVIREFKRHRFGAKSERWESPDQLVFNEAEVLTKNPKPEDDFIVENTIEVGAHTKRARGKRKPLPKHLERKIVIIELP